MIREVVGRSVWSEKGLTLIEMMFLFHIEAYEDANACFSRIEYFVNRMRLSAERCTQIIEALAVKGCFKHLNN